jgi:ABC-type transport system involved in cytochrome c biogenesis permease subunit
MRNTILATTLALLALTTAAQEAAEVAAPTAESATQAQVEETTAATEAATVEPAVTPREWDKKTLDLFATLPVQDGGRIKPLDTFARFTLLGLNGKWSMETPDGRKLKALPWLLDCLFYPEAARGYQHFIIDNAEVVAAIGLTTHEAKRDRYSFTELEDGMHKLFQLDNEYRQKEEKDLTPIEHQIRNLAENVMTFSQIIFYFEFAKRTYSGEPGTAVGSVLRPDDKAGVSLALMRLPEVMQRLRDMGRTMAGDAINKEAEAIALLMDEIERSLAPTPILAIAPSGVLEDPVWRSPADIARAAFDFQNPDAAKGNPIEILALVERLPSLRDQPEQFGEVLQAFHSKVVEAASKRGEYDKVPLEVTYYRMNFTTYSQVFFIAAFIIVALSWLLPPSRWIRYVTQAALALPLGLLITSIVIRCIIRERPPVSTLYETVLFITACCVLTALIIETMNRQRIVIAVAAFLGVAGMFLANRYEIKEGVDTMPSLIAVLDTNFWLSTHVTTVVMGYAAGMLAGAIAHIYIIGRLFRIRIADRAFYRGVTRMTYGVLCFGLLFATVGTILGGIWANDSWGRFWGWDPKENGALMIVLWSLVILHAKMGGYIRDLGINMGAIFLAIVVTFSWWGVNNLGVGLHSYGFTSGVWMNLFIFWGIETVVLLAGFGLWVLGDDPNKSAARARAASATN